jgi:conjugative relaxase-like TrwC/TraI family protein
MMTVSAGMGAEQTCTYRAEEFANAATQYYSEGGEIKGQWFGKLADHYGLRGDVDEEAYTRLAHGRHPATDELLVAPVKATPYINQHGTTITPAEHIASRDIVFSPPKEFSAALLVGGDTRLEAVHQQAVRTALTVVERYIQARANPTSETTGNGIFALFEHNSARPVDGYSAPQRHTHAVWFNQTQDRTGKVRSVQSLEMMRSQELGTAVYRTEIARGLTEAGYQWTVGEHNEPKISGFSEAYMAAISPRHEQIVAALHQSHRTGARAAQLAALSTREAKQQFDHDTMQAQHKVLAAAFGNQPQAVVAEARARGPQQAQDPARIARVAVTFAKDQQTERDAVVDERKLKAAMTLRSLGQVPYPQLEAELERRITTGELLQRPAASGSPARAFTTPEMVALEQKVLAYMLTGQDQHPPLASATTRSLAVIEAQQINDAKGLNEGQLDAIDRTLASRDKVMGIDGVAGGGKTTALEIIRRGLEREGYGVVGLAPTSSAAKNLQEVIPRTKTLQSHLLFPAGHNTPKTVYALDEASLASTAQIERFLKGLRPEDRVLLIGDTRQHQSVEAGRIFEQLQEAGMRTAHITQIVRQTDPAYLSATEDLAAGRVGEAFKKFDAQGRITEIPNRMERMAAVARDYAASPVNVITVAPDRDSRHVLNEAIHQRLIDQGQIESREHVVPVLVMRQEMTGADRGWAGKYKPGDIVRYTAPAPTHGIKGGSYATVRTVDAKANTVTVNADGRSVTYDPRRLRGVSVFTVEDRSFAVGERVRFTQPFPDKRVANGEIGTVAAIGRGTMRVRLDCEKRGEGQGRSVGFDLKDYRHLDFAYCVTSYISQSRTSQRMLFVVDTDRGGLSLNTRTAYVGPTRGREDIRVYCNDKERMIRDFSRDVSHRSAIEPPTPKPHQGLVVARV